MSWGCRGREGEFLWRACCLLISVKWEMGLHRTCSLAFGQPLFSFLLRFMYLFLATLGLCCCVRTFSSCDEQLYFLDAMRGRLVAPGSWVSVVAAHGLSCPKACGIFLDKGLNPCSLHWQADSQPLDHQTSPALVFKMHLWRWRAWILSLGFWRRRSYVFSVDERMKMKWK